MLKFRRSAGLGRLAVIRVLIRVLTPLALVASLSLILVGCGEEKVREEDRIAIEALLEDYLPKMAEAYATGNIEVLRDVAVEKELAVMYKKVNDLMNSEGREVHPTLKSWTIEDLNIWNYSNAAVTTLETWDLKVYASGSSTITSQVEDQRNRVKYQLKRRPEGWRVVFRAIETTF